MWFKLMKATLRHLLPFFKWVSDSIKTTSQKVDLTKKDTTDMDELPPPPEEINVVT